MESKESTIPPLYATLASGLQGDIDTSSHTLMSHARDNSPCFIRPHIVVFPKTAEDIKRVLACAGEYHIPVAIQGLRTNTHGAALAEGIAVDMTRYFSSIHHADPLGHTITVDAGASCEKIRNHLLGWNMEIPFLTSADDQSTIGGLLATKNTSPTSFTSGGIQSSVIGMTIILSNGEQHVLEDGITPSGQLLSIYQALFPLLAKETYNLRGAKPHAIEDPAGYNLWGSSVGPRQLIHQLLGSQGTLAVITQVKLRMTPRKKERLTYLIGIPRYSDVSRLVDICIHHTAHAISLYDTMLEECVRKYIHDEALPFIDEPHLLTLLVTLTDDDKHILHERGARMVLALSVEKNYVTAVGETFRNELFQDYSHILKLLRAYTNNSLTPMPTGTGIIVPLHKLNDTLEAIDTYHTSNRLLYSVTGNVASGHLSVMTYIDSHNANVASVFLEVAQALASIAQKHHGSMSAGSGDGIVSTPFLPQFFSPHICELFTQIKMIWDPKNILNPGKKNGLSMSYLRDRILPERQS